ncbi:MAG: gamma-glutamyltransferase [Vicinamibacterales bacterium]
MRATLARRSLRPRPPDLKVRPTYRLLLAGSALIALLLGFTTFAQTPRGEPSGGSGLREPAWSPDGSRLAVVYLDRLWTMAADGSDARELTTATGVEREPVWSPDGQQVAFAASRGESFDLYMVDARGGDPRRVTSLVGDERSPSWTQDGRLVFSYNAQTTPRWTLYAVAVDPSASDAAPRALTDGGDNELSPRVSPDGSRVAFASDRESDSGDFDIWWMPLPERTDFGPVRRRTAVRVVQGAGVDGWPAWSPDGGRVAFYAVRDGIGATWVALLGASPGSPPQLVSRHGGSLSWSPDGRTLAIGEVPEPEPFYNGNPRRDSGDRPPTFGAGPAFQLWMAAAPLAVDAGSRELKPVLSGGAALLAVFDDVWGTLSRLYYADGPARATWEARRTLLRPLAEQARSESALESVVDRMVADQPLIKAPVTSSRAMVVSAHPLASEAGRLVLERGGNIVDAAIAVSFALGVVEPDASGIGGDGQAVLFLNGMTEPTAVEFKDETPRAATLDNPRVMRGGRLVADGPASMNVPGLVAGLDYLYAKYGSGRLTWSELIDPAIRYAESGFILDETLPSTIAEARAMIRRYPSAARIYLPGGDVPRPGDRFFNRDYGTTLRNIARNGADVFYRGAVAQRMVADLTAAGGVMRAPDLDQYHPVERPAVSGRYRNHILYTGGPPVGSGVSMLEGLQVLSNFQPVAGATAARDATYWHYLIESWKARDRLRRPADPERWAADYARHLLPAHAAELFRRIEPRRASRYAEDAEDATAAAVERIGTGTSAFTIADADGNMISVTQTLSTWGGSFYVTPGLGFLYNNHLRSSRTTSGATGALLPSSRSNTSSVPTLAFREEGGRLEPAFAIGVAGNAWIPASAYSIVAALVDGRLGMQQAIEAPRFLVERDPADSSGGSARVEVEDRFPRAVLDDLSARGHRFQKIGRKGEVRYGYASGVSVDVLNRVLEGGADPRRSHAAVSVNAVRQLTQ